MAITTPNQNAIPNDPSLRDVLEYLQKEINLDLNCHHIGTVQSFDPDNQIANVTINYKKTFLKFNDASGYDSTNVDYPLIVGAPVLCLGGGAGAVTFPIAKGDECLVIFNDRDLDNWFTANATSPTNTLRLHSFADAIILVGIRSQQNVLADYDPAATTLFLGANTVKIFSNKVLVTLGTTGVTLELDSTGKFKVTNNTGEFVSALYALMTDIQNATTNTMFGPQPLIMPTFTTDLAVFNSFKA